MTRSLVTAGLMLTVGPWSSLMDSQLHFPLTRNFALRTSRLPIGHE
jgi:hypothetical protein